MRFSLVLLAAFTAGTVCHAANPVAVQDPELLKFASRAVAWYPDSKFSVVEDQTFQTSVGEYRQVSIERTCTSQFLTGSTTMIIDEVTSRAWIGAAGEIPGDKSHLDSAKLKKLVEDFLPEMIKENMRQRVRIEWGTDAEDFGALLGFDLIVDSGYGEYRKPSAVAMDGRFVVLGYSLPYDQDPVAYRRSVLASSEYVIWDHPSSKASVEIVEFSDLECPACKKKWPTIESELEKHGAAVSHGMVGFPLPTIHPWAFRSASATWCIAEQDPLKVLPFKKLFYMVQSDMEVSLVTGYSVDFLVGQGLDEEVFRACYLRDPSLNAVHHQMALGQNLGVYATPSYFINGWIILTPNEEWFGDMINRLIEGREPLGALTPAPTRGHIGEKLNQAR